MLIAQILHHRWRICFIFYLEDVAACVAEHAGVLNVYRIIIPANYFGFEGVWWNLFRLLPPRADVWRILHGLGGNIRLWNSWLLLTFLLYLIRFVLHFPSILLALSLYQLMPRYLWSISLNASVKTQLVIMLWKLGLDVFWVPYINVFVFDGHIVAHAIV